MPKEKTSENGTISISFPGRWVAMFSIPLLATMGLTFQSTRAQPEVVERAILMHSQEKHKDAASAADMQEVKYVQRTMNADVVELRSIVKNLTQQMQELIVELRIGKGG